MRFATQTEIEYIGAHDNDADNDSALIDEMSRQLDALRRYDQNFSVTDWRPEHNRLTARARASSRPR